MKSHFPNFIVELVIMAVIIVGYGFWYAAVSAKSAVVAGLQDQITAKTETATRIAAARAAIAEIAGDEAVVQGYFVSETGVVAFINGLEAQGQKQGTTVSVLSVSTDTKDTQSTLLFSIAIKGPFDAVMRTVGAIEYMPYDLSVTGLSLVQDDKNSWHADLTIRVGSVKTAATPSGSDALGTSTP